MAIRIDPATMSDAQARAELSFAAQSASSAAACAGIAGGAVKRRYAKAARDHGRNALALADRLYGAPDARTFAMVLHLADASAPALIVSPTVPELACVLMPMRVDGASVAAKVDRAAVVPVETPHDVFDRTYLAAWLARDSAGMAAAIVALRASGAIGLGSHAFDAARVHYQIAMIAARIRADTHERASDGWAAERARMKRASRIDGQLCRAWGKSTFRDLGRRFREREESAAAMRATLAAIDGYSADDTRDVLPVILQDGRKAFVTAADMRDADRACFNLVKADGTVTRSRKHSSYVYRNTVARIVQPKGKRAAAAVADAPAMPSADVSQLVDSIAALVDRVATLESTVAAQAAELAKPVAAVAADIAPAVDGTDARDAYIAALLAERDALRDERDAARAMASDMERIAEAAVDARDAAEARLRVADDCNDLQGDSIAALADKVTRIAAHRPRTAARLVAARAAARTARRERIGEATARAVAERELSRLAPLATALAGLMAPAAPVAAGGNVVPIVAAA